MRLQKEAKQGNRAFPFANPIDAWLRWIRMLFFCGSRKTNPYCAQMRSKGSLRRLVGRNLRLNRADPSLCYGQPSPLRCALLSPQGLTTLRGPPKSPRAGARRANHHPCLALVAPMSHCFAISLALLLLLPKELSLLPPPAALQFLAPQRRGIMPPVG